MNDVICKGLFESSVEVIQPFLLGCDTKNPKIVQLCLGTTQRLISQQLINEVRIQCLVDLFVTFRLYNA